MLKAEVEIFERSKVEFIEKYGEDELLRLSMRMGTKRTLQALLEGLIRAQQWKDAKAVGTNGQRLTLTYKAITGFTLDSYANESDDRDYLSHMAEIKAIELRQQSNGLKHKLSSNVTLAKRVLKADEDKLDPEKAHSAEKRLSGKFADYWRDWNELERDKLAAFEALQTTALTIFELTLKELGIPFYAYE